jgi:hypothetical protein
VVIWFREGARRNKAVLVLNASLDPVHSLCLRVLTEKTRFTHVNAVGEQRDLSGEHVASPQGHVRLTLSDLAPWSIHLLVNGPV